MMRIIRGSADDESLQYILVVDLFWAATAAPTIECRS